MTKIQVRKQFTTIGQISSTLAELFSIWRRYKFESNSQRCSIPASTSASCFQYDEDTSSKAIHNSLWISLKFLCVVFNMTKIQVRKQFTTRLALCCRWLCCFQYDEDTSSKAIHNFHQVQTVFVEVVFNMTKIQVRKQFTTSFSSCFFIRLLFSIWRRYKFESNSQPHVSL